MEVLTLQEAKAHLRVTHDALDSTIALYIRSVTDYIQSMTSYPLLPSAQRVLVTADDFACSSDGQGRIILGTAYPNQTDTVVMLYASEYDYLVDIPLETLAPSLYRYVAFGDGDYFTRGNAVLVFVPDVVVTGEQVLGITYTREVTRIRQDWKVGALAIIKNLYESGSTLAIEESKTANIMLGTTTNIAPSSGGAGEVVA